MLIGLMLKLASFCQSTNESCKQKTGSRITQTAHCTCQLQNKDFPCHDVKITSLLWNTTDKITCDGPNYVLRCLGEHTHTEGANADSTINIVLLIMLACSFGGNTYLAWKLNKMERKQDTQISTTNSAI